MSYEESARFYDYFDSKGNTGFYVELARRTTGKVLELGVGTGRVLFEICKTGREVVGIDNSVEMLREAKRKRRADCPEIAGRCRLMLADMLGFDLGETFGFVYSASGGVQGASVEDLRGIFRSAADHLEGDGTFAFDIMSPRTLRRTMSSKPERREVAGGRFVIRFCAQTYNEETDITSFDILYKEIIPGRTAVETYHETAQVAVITTRAVEEALGYAGLRLVSLYGDFDRRPYNDESSWMVVVAGR